MSELSSGRADVPAATYYYRRPLSAKELLPAVGAGIFAGVAGFYLARIFLQRTPFVRERGITQLDERGVVVARPERGVAGE